nr:hypothetical protein [Candidatus Sigynarchaeum springense]
MIQAATTGLQDDPSYMALKVLSSIKGFIELVRDYHARWLIENGFKVVKESFCRDIRSCKPTARQFVLVLGMMLHN